MQKSDYINFGDFARNELGMQGQYASYFYGGIAGHPNLCKGLRVIARIPGLYHTLEIHKDDAPVLKLRVKAWLKDPIAVEGLFKDWSLNDEQQCAEQMERILQNLKEGE